MSEPKVKIKRSLKFLSKHVDQMPKEVLAISTLGNPSPLKSHDYNH